MHLLKNKTYWLFDMDGTLTNAMHDFDAMRTELKLPAGVPILEALAAMAPEEAAIKHRQLDEMEIRMAADATPQPGSTQLLEYLGSTGARLGIVTRNGREIADVTLRACELDGFFDEQSIISRDCCTAKPDPAGVNLLLSRWQGSATNAVMVGDYLFDLQAGHSAGTATVHMDVSGEFAWPEFTDLSVRSLHELYEHII
ncbi:MAG: HAD family hydrolase [Granulosicoccus sp.]